MKLLPLSENSLKLPVGAYVKLGQFPSWLPKWQTRLGFICKIMCKFYPAGLALYGISQRKWRKCVGLVSRGGGDKTHNWSIGDQALSDTQKLFVFTRYTSSLFWERCSYVRESSSLLCLEHIHHLCKCIVSASLQSVMYWAAYWLCLVDKKENPCCK